MSLLRLSRPALLYGCPLPLASNIIIPKMCNSGAEMIVSNM
jgi:hypothetical protein